MIIDKDSIKTYLNAEKHIINKMVAFIICEIKHGFETRHDSTFKVTYSYKEQGELWFKIIDDLIFVFNKIGVEIYAEVDCGLDRVMGDDIIITAKKR